MMESQVFFESMERRRLLSAAIVGSTVHVAGTTGDDRITVSLDHKNTDRIHVNVNGHVTTFDVAAVKLIRIEGRRGNDDIEIDQSNGAITAKTLIFGGAGDDS